MKLKRPREVFGLKNIIFIVYPSNFDQPNFNIMNLIFFNRNGYNKYPLNIHSCFISIVEL